MKFFIKLFVLKLNKKSIELTFLDKRRDSYFEINDKPAFNKDTSITINNLLLIAIFLIFY